MKKICNTFPDLKMMTGLRSYDIPWRFKKKDQSVDQSLLCFYIHNFVTDTNLSFETIDTRWLLTKLYMCLG